MKLTLIAAVAALSLAACDPISGAFKSPVDMSPAERCANAQVGLAAAEASGVVSQNMLDTFNSEIEVFCAPVTP